ncbi:ABC transporter permease [Sedimentibacter sp. MB31-C6]|uniref:ABC transporter permease n=1 Tax=Sedimentibacter sp. MB31-C6 TaxID=3109366 RepID=UPI002DDD6416|nr:ABC transporter permease [Sedimentibacter sp. MB36-C1]WSI02839.1 ABC transporter permease [Sedimentibacter sp. MB36-C1]
MMEIVTVLWREYLFFKRRIARITLSAIMSPILYLIAFGWGLGKDVVVEGSTYMHFIIPGIIAITTMNTGFNAVSSRIITSKLYERSFEYYLTSPISMPLMSLGYAAALSIESHYDMGRFNTYIMTPMSFLCGTFFSLENLPDVIKAIIGILPLSHASVSLRSIVLKGNFYHKSIAVLLIYAVLLYLVGVKMSYREMK